jgi:hypothetical protein
MGRSTDNWYSRYTAADILLERLPHLLDLELGMTAGHEIGEEDQGEPFTDYYCYQPGTSIIVDSNWRIPDSCRSGTLVLSVAKSSVQAVRGFVLEVCDEDEHVLARANAQERIESADGTNMEARWVRFPTPPQAHDWKILYRMLEDADPFPSKVRPCRTDAGELRIRGALFLQEIRVGVTGNGWLFACDFRPAASWQRNAKDRKPGLPMRPR